MPTMPEQAQIHRLIPHAGAMCLLDRVEAWDEVRIRCSAGSHHRADNPLRRAGVLHAICAVEYAAQAMAAHGALLAGTGAAPRAGLLVALREVVCAAAHLDAVAGDLRIEAQRELGDARQAVYRFAVSAADRQLVAGRATVSLDAGAGRPAGPASA